MFVSRLSLFLSLAARFSPLFLGSLLSLLLFLSSSLSLSLVYIYIMTVCGFKYAMTFVCDPLPGGGGVALRPTEECHVLSRADIDSLVYSEGFGRLLTDNARRAVLFDVAASFNVQVF